jgi:glutaconate CoA-transferase subunit B
VVISNLAVMNFKNPERMMQIQHYHPGHTIEEIKENTGFDLRVAPDASETPVPTQDIVDLIAEIDRDGVRLSEFH